MLKDKDSATRRRLKYVYVDLRSPITEYSAADIGKVYYQQDVLNNKNLQDVKKTFFNRLTIFSTWLLDLMWTEVSNIPSSLSGTMLWALSIFSSLPGSISQIWRDLSTLAQMKCLAPPPEVCHMLSMTGTTVETLTLQVKLVTSTVQDIQKIHDVGIS